MLKRSNSALVACAASWRTSWATVVKREREAELIWRGTQYARAIDLFRQKHGYVSPPDVETLLNERLLRRRYTDPMTSGGEFQLLYAIQQPDRDIPENLADPLRQPPEPDARGGIIGVVSRSPDSGGGCDARSAF